MTTPDWFILIERWVPHGMGHNGVTLPFLVGALAYKAGQRGHLGARHVWDVLDDITQHPVEGYVTKVSWCLDISAPVLNTKRIDSPERMPSSVAIPRPSGEGQSLVFGMNLDSRWGFKNAVASLVRLAEDATEPVSRGRYSRRRKKDTAEFEYGDFSDKECEYIQITIMTSIS